MKKTTILFDLDGTLIDSTEAIVLSFLDVFDRFGLDRAKEDDIKKHIGHTLEDMFLSLGVDENLIEKCVKEYKINYRKRSLDLTSLLPRAKEAIELAYSFAHLGIVTTKTGRYSKEILEYLGVMHYFDVLIGREHVEHPKPHKEPIEKALFLMGATKENCWMIGDTTLDILSAKNADIKAVGVLSGYGKKEELMPHCNIIADDALEALRQIKQL